MSCPDWTALVAWRERIDEDPPGWQEALDHLDGCPSCRDAATAADPLLIFRRLPLARVAPGEAESMQASVAAMIRASAVTGQLSPQPAAAGSSSLRRRLWTVAASLLLAAGTLIQPSTRLVGTAAAPGASLPAGQATDAPVQMAASVENLNLPDARVYEIAQEGLQVVMVVDPSLNL